MKNSNEKCKIKKQSRWTTADKDLAKELLSFDVKKIKKVKGKVLFIYEGLCFSAPNEAFESLKENETILLKDIIDNDVYRKRNRRIL